MDIVLIDLAYVHLKSVELVLSSHLGTFEKPTLHVKGIEI